MLARDLMTSDVVTTTPDTDLLTAIDLLLTKRITGLPVCDAHGRLVGILTEGDLLRRSELGTGGDEGGFWFRMSRERRAERYARLHGRHVSAVMTKGVESVAPDDTLVDVVAKMQTQGIRRVTVIDGDRLVGIISRRDIVRALRDRLADAGAPMADQEIVDRITQRLSSERWAPHDVKVTCQSGNVTFTGEARDEADLDGLRAMATGLPGVKAARLDRVFLQDGLGYARAADIDAGINPPPSRETAAQWFRETGDDEEAS
jgi:CBS domain-containing protein